MDAGTLMLRVFQRSAMLHMTGILSFVNTIDASINTSQTLEFKKVGSTQARAKKAA